MREARDRVLMNRTKENEKRKKLGQAELPTDTFNYEVNQMSQTLFEEIKEKETTMVRMERK
jgi:hypothetical protein